MSITRIIGIDFGTSTSVIRVKRYKEDGQSVDDKLYTAEVKFGNSDLVPTLIQKIEDGLPYYGYEAQKPHKKAALFQSFKVDLESRDSEIREQARALTEEFFAYMAKQYKEQSSGGFFGEAGDTEKTLVSYPVKWSGETRKLMLEAAKKAGFSNVEGMDEAQAAITAVMVQSESYLSEKGYLHDGTPVNILMIDMGAGTTDLVLCRYTPGRNAGYEMLSVWPRDGKTFFGGREVEELLQEYLRGKLPEEDADAVMKRCGLEKFKSWKEDYVSPALSRGESVTEFSDLDMIAELLEIDMEDYSLDRAELERLALNYLRGFPRLVNGCLKDAGIPGSEVDLVLLTGGHSQWYFVAELLSGKLSQCGEIDLSKMKADPGRIIPVPRPQETVALGLVYNPLMEQIQFAAKSEPKPAPEPVPQPAPQPVPQPAPKPTPQPVSQAETLQKTASKLTVEKDLQAVLQKNEEEPFRIVVEDIFKITGRGIVITGRIQSGSVKLNDKVFLQSQNGIVKAVVVRGIEMDRELHETACKGDEIGLLLGDVHKNDIRKGDIIFKPSESALGNEARLDTDEEFGFRPVGGNHKVEINRDSADTYVLTIVRQNQFNNFCYNIKIIVDDSETYKLANDSSIQILLSPGRHKIAFSLFTLQKKIVYVTVDGDMTLNVKFSGISNYTNKIDVYRNGIKL